MCAFELIKMMMITIITINKRSNNHNVHIKVFCGYYNNCKRNCIIFHEINSSKWGYFHLQFTLIEINLELRNIYSRNN